MEKHYEDNALLDINERNSMNFSTFSLFVMSFALRSNWNSIVFFFPNSSGILSNLSPIIFNYFSSAGKFISVHTISNPLLPQSILHAHHRLGIVCFCENPEKDFFSKVSELELFDAYHSWLIVGPQESKKMNKLEEILNALNLELATEMMFATLKKRAFPQSTLTISKESFSNFSINDSKRGNHIYASGGDPNAVVYVTQIYKAKRTENETIKIDLGFWDAPNGLLRLKQQISPDRKFNLGGSKIQVGVINSTVNSGDQSTRNALASDAELDEKTHFLELLNCLMYGLNASYELNRFQKLGWRNEEGVWTHLLGAVVEGTVEIGLDAINVDLDKLGDISFTHAILSTMSNVYFRQPDSGGMRDIFLEPFGSKLLLCLFSTTFFLGLAMIIINYGTCQVQEKATKRKKLQIVRTMAEKRSMSISIEKIKKWKVSEAVLWSISVLCMQGSNWYPQSISGNLLLINSLLFSLVIYNSFAAFITSVLSVKDVKIKNLKDLSESDFAFGYTLGNTDELFLRSVNNTRLRELYFKGFKENDGVSDAIFGMQRAANGKYAFFVSARTARRIIKTVMAQKSRCQIQEIYIPSTKTYASIPLTKISSLKSLLNAKCLEEKTFHSARLTDVYSAFFILSIGWIVSLIIFFIEIICYGKKKIKN